MGEIAEMMLDGTLCIICGGYVEDSEGKANGHPRPCEDKNCKKEFKQQQKRDKEKGEK